MSLSTAEKRALLTSEMDDLIRTYGENADDWPIGQAKLGERILNGIRKLDAQDELERSRAARADVIRAAVADTKNHENGFGGGPTLLTSNHGDPWRDLGDNVSRSDSYAGLEARAHTVLERMDEAVPDEGREKLARMLDHDKSLDSAAFVIAASDPAYVRAFEKSIGNEHGHRLWTPEEQMAYARVESVRAGMGEGGSGTYLVPIPLDPSIVLTNVGTINPIRRLARTETTANAVWTGVASAGSTAYWTAENTALTEANPTLVQISVTPRKMTTWLTASFELTQDSTLTQQLPELIADAFGRAESAAFINGNGTTEPMGVITAISATVGSTVTATTRGSFTSASVADLFAVDNVLPARARANGASWVMNRKTINTTRQMAASNYGSSFWANLAENTPIQLLDHPMYEASSVLSTTTTGTVLAVLGDFSKYLLVDRIGTQIEFVQNVVDTNGVPTGTRGWVGYKRVGAAVENIDAFRFLLM